MTSTDGAASFGKYGGPTRVVNVREVDDPLEQTRRRLVELGADDKMIAEAVDAHRRGRVNLRSMTDDELTARVVAIAAGSGAGWVEADRASIDQARDDQALWVEVNEADMMGKRGVIGGNIGQVLAWVGLDAGRAVVAHYAENERAEEEARAPRKSLLAMLRGIHGQGDLEGDTDG